MKNRHNPWPEHSLDELFEPEGLRTEERIELAILTFEDRLSEQNFERNVRALLSKPNLFGFVFSGLTQSCHLSQWILASFPTTSSAFLNSLHLEMVSKFSRYFAFLPHSFGREMQDALKTRLLAVELSPKLLNTLHSTTFDACLVDNGVSESNDPFPIKVKAKSQRAVKQVRRAACTSLDPSPFQSLGHAIPTTREQAEELIGRVLIEQKQILEFYLTLLKDSDILASTRGAYLFRPRSLTPSKAVENNAADNTATSSIEEGESTNLPVMQSVKASLYFDSAEILGEWRILMSTRAEHDLRVARRADAKMFKIYLKKIKELSNGHFSPDNQKRLNGPQTEVPIFEAKMTGDTRLVYQVDCYMDYSTDVEQQAITIFGIYTHAQLDQRLWDSLSRQLEKKGKTYKQRCVHRKRRSRSDVDVFVPESWPPRREVIPEVSNHLNLPPEDLDEIHSLLTLQKFIPFSQAFLNSILADQDVQHVFQVTSEEMEIIEHDTSCYVLGRSGTGKTTTMMFKMLGIERAWDQFSCTKGLPKPHQMFVTQSRVLASKVQEYFSRLTASLAAGDKSREEIAALAREKKYRQESEELIDADDDLNWKADLPDRFSELCDDHFPLFITFDGLCNLLKADFPALGRHAISSHWPSSNKISKDGAGNFLTYGTFLEYYWPHFPQARELDPFLVFSEIMGVIKGSEQTLTHPERFLSKEAYEGLSLRMQSRFASHRTLIYDIFQLYTKRKRQRDDYDVADRTHHLLSALKTHGVPGEKIEYLFVDEAQDNLIVDALLLRSLCNNSNGLFWAGDTAQTISVGSSFRFNDLKALLYRIERSQSSEIALVTTSAVEPKTFQLSVNYRSHKGIVNCAHSVVELITLFWPYTIDNLSREHGVVDGHRPVFFTGWDSNTARYEQFLFGARGDRIEFGAQQCILVRDDAGRARLREQVGDIGLILTLYESKGLEFNDVLLYNFFEDSTVELPQWRVVLNAVKPAVKAPAFNEMHHAGVCSELKFLYVAVTRARKNLWILDCSERSEPMRILWASKNLIENCTPGTNVPQLAVKSSPKEWADSGRVLFENKRYLQAMHCLQRANLPADVAVANAYHLRELARGVSSKSTRERSRAFVKAGDAFVDCASTAAKQKLAYYRIAGGCHEQAGDLCRAAELFIHGEDFTRSARLYHKAERFEEAWGVVKAHHERIDIEVVNQVKDAARLLYFKLRKFDKASELFASPEEELEYTEAYDFDVARAALLERLGKYSDAAELHLAEGRTLEGIQLLLRDPTQMTSVIRGQGCILDGLWQHVSFGTDIASIQSDQNFHRLLELGEQLLRPSLEGIDRNEISMFKAISTGDMRELQRLFEKFNAFDNVAETLLCLENVLKVTPHFQIASISEVAETLEAFVIYAQLLRRLACDSNPGNNPSVRKLFALQSASNDIVLVPANTFLHRQLKNDYPQQDENILISKYDLTQKFQKCLNAHLRNRVLEVERICRKTRAFEPCLQLLILGQCFKTECFRAHFDASELTRGFYNTRVRIHLRQILALQTLPLNASSQRVWLKKLYEALQPQWYTLGCLQNLENSVVRGALPVVKDWARHLLYSAHRGFDADPLTSAMIATALIFNFDRENAKSYVHRAPCVTPHVKDLITFLEGAVPNSIISGIDFLSRVIFDRVPVDICALCDLVDHICANLVFYKKRREGNLHNLTLPRSWIINMLSHSVENDKDIRQLMVFVNVAFDLLRHLYDSADSVYLFHEGRPLLQHRTLTHNLFIARICRSLSLWYNVQSEILRDNILKKMRSLALPPGQIHPSLFRQYASATSWRQIVHAVWNLMSGSTMDEMVFLCHSTRKPASNIPKSIRVISFSAQEEILGLLGVSQATKSQPLRAQAAAFVPSHQLLPAAEAGDDSTATEEPAVPTLEHEDEQEEILQEEILEAENDHEMDAATTPDIPLFSDTAPQPSEEENHAALVIQRMYKQYRRQQKSRAGKLNQSRNHHFGACLAQSKTLSFPSRRYRLMFLGTLPHLLVCIEAVNTYALEAKAKQKRLLHTGKNDVLVESGKRLTHAVHLLKGAKRLQQILQPGSDTHLERKYEIFEKYTMEVQKLVSQLPGNAERQAIQGDLGLALRAIQPPKPKPKRTLKPELNMDEDGEEMDEEDEKDEDEEDEEQQEESLRW